MDVANRDKKLLNIIKQLDKLTKNNENDKLKKYIKDLNLYLTKEVNSNKYSESIINKVNHQKDKLSKIII
jgi:endonuclease III